MLIPLHQLHFGPNVPAGMDWSVIGMHHVYLRKTSEPCNPPILVTPCTCQHWCVTDGRHRTVASYIAGRSSIEAVDGP